MSGFVHNRKIGFAGKNTYFSIKFQLTRIRRIRNTKSGQYSYTYFVYESLSIFMHIRTLYMRMLYIRNIVYPVVDILYVYVYQYFDSL